MKGISGVDSMRCRMIQYRCRERIVRQKDLPSHNCSLFEFCYAAALIIWYIFLSPVLLIFLVFLLCMYLLHEYIVPGVKKLCGWCRSGLVTIFHCRWPSEG